MTNRVSSPFKPFVYISILSDLASCQNSALVFLFMTLYTLHLSARELPLDANLTPCMLEREINIEHVFVDIVGLYVGYILMRCTIVNTSM